MADEVHMDRSLRLLALFVCLAGAIPAQPPALVVSTLAGKTHDLPFDGGPATQALLVRPWSVAVDSAGVVYFADPEQARVGKIADGVISTAFFGRYLHIAVSYNGKLVGTDGLRVWENAADGTQRLIAGTGGYACPVNGAKAVESPLGGVTGVAGDAAGNVYFLDEGCYRLWKVGRDGNLVAVGGSGQPGFSGDGGPATAATFYRPGALVIDQAGNLYFTDSQDSRIRKIDAGGTISTIAGTGEWPFGAPPLRSGALATGVPLMIDSLTRDAAGNLYAGVSGGIIRISAGVIYWVAGGTEPGFRGDAPVAALSAKLTWPAGLAATAAGDLYFSDYGNFRIRKVNRSSGLDTVTTIAGRSHFEGDGGPARDALIHRPQDLAFDGAGNLYFGDVANHRIRKITPSGVISTVVGTGMSGPTQDGAAALAANLDIVGPMAVDSKGQLWFASNPNSAGTTAPALRRMGADGKVWVVNDAEWAGSIKALATDAQGNVFITSGSQIARIAADGKHTILAGGKGWPAPSCSGPTLVNCIDPAALSIAPDGSLLFAETGWVRKISPTGVVTRIAGNGTQDSIKEGAPAADSPLPEIMGLAMAKDGSVYLLTRYYGLLQVDPAGRIWTIERYLGLYGATGITISPAGLIYVADANMNMICVLGPNTPVKAEMVSGDRQTVVAWTTPPKSFQVRVIGATGAVLQNWPVSYQIRWPDGEVSGLSGAKTDQYGVAAFWPWATAAAGVTTVTATVAGLAPVTFTFTVLPQPLEILPRGVMGAGLSEHVLQEISPNRLVSIYGTRFAAEGTNKTVGPDDLVDGKLPRVFAGTCVEIGGEKAFLLYVSTIQVNLVVPPLPAAQDVPIQVVTGCGTGDEKRTPPVKAAVRAATPEFLFAARTPDGKMFIEAFDAADGSGILPTRPAKPGQWLILSGTGFGPAQPSAAPGLTVPEPAPLAASATVTFGSRALSGEAVSYVGLAVGRVGLYEVRLQVPPDMPEGDHEVVVRVGDEPTPASGYVRVSR
jgi:uncharacterized protein (TIGR03437 family)